MTNKILWLDTETTGTDPARKGYTPAARCYLPQSHHPQPRRVRVLSGHTAGPRRIRGDTESRMSQCRLKGILDKNEAPHGYIAVEKDSLGPFDVVGNYCRHCDYRPHCNGLVRCMSFEVVRPDGAILTRKDGCSVVFKQLPAVKEPSCTS